MPLQRTSNGTSWKAVWAAWRHFRHARRTLPGFPDERYQGRGIVMGVGGERCFTNAWIHLHLLRESGCRLPVQAWHFGKAEWAPGLATLLEPLQVEVVDGEALLAGLPRGSGRGFALKVAALHASRFREVLWLDADNAPVMDPGFLFDDPLYLETGALFWPDIRPLDPRNPLWRITGTRSESGMEWESGQIVLDKRRWWQPLELAWRMNQAFPLYYPWSLGDKQTFFYAARALRVPTSVVPHAARLVAANPAQSLLEQHAPEGRVLFQHRTQSDWTLFGDNPVIPGFRAEARCRALLETLRSLWNGRLHPDPDPWVCHGQRFGPGMREPAWFHCVRRGAGRLLLRLDPDGTIANASPWDGETWRLDGPPDRPRLLLEGCGTRIAEFEPDGAGGWTGRKALAERMEMRLIPAPPHGLCVEPPGQPRFAEHECVTECPACGSEHLEPLQNPDVKRCRDCRTAFRSPRPTGREIFRVYDSGITFARWEGEEEARTVLWHRRLGLLRRHRAGKRLLDVGTGDGRFAKIAAAEGYEVRATEASSRGIELCRRRGLDGVLASVDDESLAPASFDTVTLWHVLEHVPDPGRLLRRVHALLRPGGLVFIAVPNETRRILRPPWRPKRRTLGPLHWGLEVHLIHFQPTTLRRAVRRAGFAVAGFGVDDVDTRPTAASLRKRTRQEWLARLTGWHLSNAMFAVGRKPGPT